MAEKQSKWRIFTAGYPSAENPVTVRLVLGWLLGTGCYHHGIRRFGHGPGHDVRSGLL